MPHFRTLFRDIRTVFGLQARGSWKLSTCNGWQGFRSQHAGLLKHWQRGHEGLQRDPEVEWDVDRMRSTASRWAMPPHKSPSKRS